jgi:hypothetical protein
MCFGHEFESIRLFRVRMERVPVVSHPWGDRAEDTAGCAQVNPCVNDSTYSIRQHSHLFRGSRTSQPSRDVWYVRVSAFTERAFSRFPLVAALTQPYFMNTRVG